MVRALCELDYEPLFAPGRPVAMVTLTYPGDWETVAPDGATAKRQLQAFFKRYEAAWGHSLVCVWKLEFQRRGAPHYHLLMAPPHGEARRPKRGRQPVGAGLPFRKWLSAVWADVVSHPDVLQRMRHELAGTGVDFAEGQRASDPRRAAVYFLKHGSAKRKEYQHVVPQLWRESDGVGRWWGYRVLERVTVAVEVDDQVAIVVARTLRRWARAQGTTRDVTVKRTRRRDRLSALNLGEPVKFRSRHVRRRVERLSNPQGTGWVSTPIMTVMVFQLARFLPVAGQRRDWTDVLVPREWIRRRQLRGSQM